MGKRLRILEKDCWKWFLVTKDWAPDGQGDGKYNTDYRYAVCYSLLHYLAKSDHDKNRGEQALRELCSCFDAGSNFSKEDFLEVLWLRDGGFVVVDRAKGMYPLVCNRNNRDHEYEQAAHDVLDNYDAVFSVLRDHRIDNWTKEFQEQLENVFCRDETVGAIPATRVSG